MINVDLFDDLDDVAADAAGALDRDAQAVPYHRLSWFRLLEAHCPPQGKLAVARAQDGDRKAWLFLTNGGAEARSYAAWYSLRFAPIGDPTLLSAIARRLAGKGLASVELAPVEAPEPIIAAFRAAGWTTAIIPAAGNWHVATQGQSYDAFLAERPGQVRSTIKRKSKSAGLDIVIHDRFDTAAWADYERVYAESWKGDEGSPAFLRAFAEQEGAAGTLRLGIASLAGRPIAAQLWIIENGIATIHKLAYSEDCKPLSPGTLLSAAMFRRAIDEDRVVEIDYGTGDDAYKRDWMDERRQLWRVLAWNRRSLRGLIGYGRHSVSSLVRRWRSR